MTNIEKYEAIKAETEKLKSTAEEADKDPWTFVAWGAFLARIEEIAHS